ncbi:MAG: SRPBCC family protein [Planctomycetales bacterium]|nr:SRPBCC family protein [Planctomycetales bacterium]
MDGPTTGVPQVNEARRPARQFLVYVLMALLALFALYFARGAWAAKQAKDPASPQDGVICQLVRDPDGEKVIRTAVVIPVPIETAWRILSDYGEWERLFKTIRRKQLSEPIGENQHHVVSQVTTPLGTLSLDFIVTHEKTADGGYLAWWDAPTDELPINKGTIRITPRGDGETLFVYTVHKQYRRYPSFLVNNMLLRHQPDLVRTLAARMEEVAHQP